MQKIFQGIEHLEQSLNGSHKVLLVCDSSFPFLNIRNEIENMSIPYVKFDGFSSNPLYEDVCKGVAFFQSEGCDTIMAVGGGSCIDVAKCIKLFSNMSKDRLYLDQEFEDTGVKLIAIPTTAGTGSESTRYAVIYYDGKKQSITHDSIIPDVAILEPKVLSTLPLYQKKCTMLDALCQGIESWWSVNSTEKSKTLSKEAVKTIIYWWREYIFENSEEAAEQMMKAANLAGQAICITQTTAPHAFSYKLTSMFHLPHGHTVAICLPEIWDYMINNMEFCVDDRGADYVMKIFGQIARALGGYNLEDGIEQFRLMLDAMEIDHPISSDIVHDLNILSTSVNPIRLRNNPISFDEKGIRMVYENVVWSE